MTKCIAENETIVHGMRKTHRSPLETFADETALNGKNGSGEAVGVKQIEMAVGASSNFFVEHAPEVLLLVEVEV